MINEAYLSIGTIIVFALGMLTMAWSFDDSGLALWFRRLRPYWVGSAATIIATGTMIYQIGWLGFPLVSIAGGTVGYLASQALPRSAIAGTYMLALVGIGLILLSTLQ